MQLRTNARFLKIGVICKRAASLSPGHILERRRRHRAWRSNSCNGTTSPVARQVTVKSELAWVEGRLVFEGTSAAQAISEFNRRNEVQIELPDPKLATTRIYGRFKVAEPEEFVKFVAALPRE